MIPVDPYSAYAEYNPTAANPTTLIVALYEAAIAAVRSAKTHLESGDIMVRGKAITKAVNIVSELLVSLNHEQGGKISRNLERLYVYMRKQLLAAHAQQTREPLEEVDRLLSTLLEGWREISEEQIPVETASRVPGTEIKHYIQEMNEPNYGVYCGEFNPATPCFSLAC